MISYCDKYVQIKLIQNSKILSKVIAYTDKHFSNNFKLSSSILILDDGKNAKKNYLINWCHHAINYSESMTAKEELEIALANSHLPIRIKMVKPTDLLEKINVRVQTLGASRIILTLSKRNRIAERYIKNTFGKNYIGISQNEIYLQFNGNIFWEQVLEFLGNKVIHNIALNFEYNDFNVDEFTFLTHEERNLRRCYAILDSQFGDEFEIVKRRYLKLAKEYHPDNFYNDENHDISYELVRFHEITDAYKKIKQLNKKIH